MINMITIVRSNYTTINNYINLMSFYYLMKNRVSESLSTSAETSTLLDKKNLSMNLSLKNAVSLTFDLK